MAADEPVLDVDEIQGNVLAGFNKDFQAFLALRVEDPAVRSRAWIRDTLAPLVADSSLSRVAHHNRAFRQMRALAGEPTDLRGTWTNVAFAASGLRLLAPGLALPVDEAFRAGLPARSAGLGDPANPDDEGHPAQWVAGGARPFHLLVIIAADRQTDRDTRHAALRDSAAASGLVEVHTTFGEDLSAHGAPRGSEHFGFKDGISQPGIRGRLSDAPGDFLTRRLIDLQAPETDPAYRDPNLPEFSRPGSPLLWPGEFVLGWPPQDLTHPRRPGVPQPPESTEPPWTRNGSYVVWRRLRQDVASFRQFMEEEAARLRTLPGLETMTEESLAARLVGRWKSGAPVIRTPDADDPALADDRMAPNHFGWASTKPVAYAAGVTPRLDPFPMAGSDVFGQRCPYAGHIRKVNPRDQAPELGSSTDTLRRRILRRGIPFGSPLPADPASPDPIQGNRGLVFVCYQSSIVRQFEFLIRNWVSQPDKPRGNAGHDVLLASVTPRHAVLRFAGRPDVRVETSARWIVPTGGDYLFAPSITALIRDIANLERLSEVL